MLFRSLCFLLLTILTSSVYGQTIDARLKAAMDVFEKDPQLSTAISSLYVIEAGTGKVIFDKNGQVGLAPASTQKIITSISAYEILGRDFKYRTRLYLHSSPSEDPLVGIRSSGDPTFGSPRYTSTRPAVIMKKLGAVVPDGLATNFALYDSAFETQRIPDGWIWQDIGNYYGAGSAGFNWRENQVDIQLQSGADVGDPVTITQSYSDAYSGSGRNTANIINELRSAAKGTGDNAYYYFGNSNGGEGSAYLKGTIPAGESEFSISIAVADPLQFFAADWPGGGSRFGVHSVSAGKADKPMSAGREILVHESPSLDSIIYWFNKKSINLYGEALMKSMGLEGAGMGATDKGITVLREFWADKGINEHELNMYDGSGLSPLNRVTTHAQVTMLNFAKKRAWFPAFHDALPTYNDMKMKSGTISDVKGFCGYHRSKDGKEYVFSFLVNNYNGRSSELVNKMYKVLNVLK